MKITEFDSYDIPDNIKEDLKNYYQNTDHRAILNDSYTRYPFIDDFGIYPKNHPDFTLSKLDQWFLDNGASLEEGHVIIHWNW